MNPAIRSWIEENHQPWRLSPKQSAYRGPIGSAGALPLGADALKYFERHGIAVQGRLWEDVMEDEMLGVLETVSSLLPEDDRKKLDERAAFGLSLTNEPNACAIRCLGGYAILFDHYFDTLLISAIELYASSLLPPTSVTEEDFPAALNSFICTDFFSVTDMMASLAYRAREGFAHRAFTDKTIWFFDVFLLAHEVGHVMLNHLEHASERNALFKRDPGPVGVRVLQPEHRQEFEADAYAVEVLFRGDAPGGLVLPGWDPKVVWQANYSALGWLFSILGAIEELAARIGFPITDTHPSGAERWRRIEQLIRDRVPIEPGVTRLDQVMRDKALVAARFGAIPEIRKDKLKELESYVAFPMEALQEALRPKQGEKYTWPPLKVFHAWIGAPTIEEGRRILKENPGLLHPDVDTLHILLAERQTHELARHHVLEKRLPLLQRCRQIGVGAAFDEISKPLQPAAPAPVFEVPMDKLKAYGSALDAQDEERMKELVASSAELAAFVRLPDTALLFTRAATPADSQRVLEGHPELLLPTADLVLKKLVECQQTEAARERMESFRAILEYCRELGIAEGIAKACRIWGVNHQGKKI